MENQEMNPQEEYLQVQQKILNGDVETAQRMANGEFRELREASMSYQAPEGPVMALEESSMVTPESAPEQAVLSSDSVSEEPAEVVEENEDAPFDQEAHDRAIYDQELAAHNEKVRLAEERAAEVERQLEEERARIEKILKDQELERQKADQDIFDLDSDEVAPQVVETTQAPQTVTDTSGVDELRAELAQLRSQLDSKNYWDGVTKSYGDFWDSEEGKDFAPTQKREVALKDFETFYGDLAENLNDRDALRFMYDVRKNGFNDFYKQKLDEVGMTLPEEFDKLYDSMEVAHFAEGKKIDPRLGKLVDTGRGTFNNFNDAYFILNKDVIVADARKKSFDDIQKKLREKEESAIQVNPNKYAPLSMEMQKIASPEYRQGLIRKAWENGYDGASMSSIKDPAVREQMQELHATIKSLKQQ